jgi:hypothetical protein
MRIITTIILLLTLVGSCFGQETEKFAKKIADNMCNCLGNIDKYKDLKPKLDSCYDKKINEAAIQATSEEIKIIGNINEFNKVKQSLEELIKTNCEAVKKLVEKELNTTSTENPYPTNFTSHECKKAKKNLDQWNGEIVAFDGEIVEVNYPSPNKPYLKVRMEGGQTIWIGSMVNSQYDKVGNTVRFLGYFTLTSKDDISKSYHDFGFHILVFGEIDHKTKQLAMLPGSELQIKQWGLGQIPKGK